MTKGSWRLARVRSGARLPLISVAVLAIILIVLGKSQSAIFDHARSYIFDGMRPLLVASAGKVDDFNNSLHAIGSIFTIFEDNKRLREENARLLKWQSTAQVLQERLKHYRALLHAVPDPKMRRVVARVIGHSVHPFQQTLILDAGQQNGVQPGEAVVDGRGMIGRIFLSGQHTAWVIPLTDSNSRIPVTVVPGNYHAIMVGDSTQTPTLENLSLGAAPKAGAQVLTSGDGDLLPPGLPIGVVVISRGRARVSLFADQNVSQDVEVLDFLRPVEHPSDDITQNDLPVVAAGLQPEKPPKPAAECPTDRKDTSDHPLPPPPLPPAPKPTLTTTPVPAQPKEGT